MAVMRGRVAFAIALVWVVGTCGPVMAAATAEEAGESGFVWLRRIGILIAGLMAFGALVWRQKREPEMLPTDREYVSDSQLEQDPLGPVAAEEAGQLYARGATSRRDRRRWPYPVQPLFLAQPAARRAGPERFDRKTRHRRVGIMWG